MDCNMLLEAYYRRYLHYPISTLTSGDRPHEELHKCLADEDRKDYLRNLEHYARYEFTGGEPLARAVRNKQLDILHRNANWITRWRMTWEYVFNR